MPLTAAEQEIIKSPFNGANSAHFDLLAKHSTRLQESLQTIRAHDIWMMRSSAAALAGYVLSFIPLLPFTTFTALAGVGATGWFLKGRQAISSEHQAVLQDTVELYDWCFQAAVQNGSVEGVLRVSEVQDLTLILAPLLATKKWKKWSENDLTKLAGDEALVDRATRQVGQAAKHAGQKLFNGAWNLLGLPSGASDEQADISREHKETTPEANRLFVLRLVEHEKGPHIGTVDFRTYGHEQSFNPLSVFNGMLGDAKNKVVDEMANVMKQGATP